MTAPPRRRAQRTAMIVPSTAGSPARNGLPRPGSAWSAAAFAGLTAGAAALGARTVRVARTPWYAALRKPRWQPPRGAFGPVWTLLYGLVATSGYRVWRTRSPARARALGLWGAQLALNAAWTPLFFGARRPRAALLDAALLVPCVAAYAWTAARADRPAAWIVVPYLAWTGFALALNGELVRRNARTLARR
jgi:translocator protein